MSEDFYDVLGVSRDADEDEINRAFREKAAKYHPDVSDDPEAEDRFKKIKKAKEVLTDEEKRQLYDQLGHDQFVQAEKHGATDQDAGGARGAGGPFGGQGGPFGGGAGGFEDIFEQFFGGGGRRQGRQGPRGGQDLRTTMTVDLEDAYHGVETQITVRRPDRCPTCDGAGHPPDATSQTCPECNGQGQTVRTQQTPFGRVQQTTTCPQCEGRGDVYSETCRTCGGEGITEQEATLTVDIPAGVQSGQTVRLRGEGAPGEPGAPDGDLLIDVDVRDHDVFDRDGADLYRRQPISFPQAVFGDTVEVETIDGVVEMDIPAGTQSGERFRLSGEGMPRLERRGYGDLYVDVQVVVPESLDAEQREALEAYAEAGGEEIEVEDGFFERLRNSL